MAVNGAGNHGVARPWSVLAWHDWDGDDELVTTLSEALYNLDGVDEGDVLYDYVDVELVVEAFSPDRAGWGITEVTFECEHHEVRISQDGTIAARSV